MNRGLEMESLSLVDFAVDTYEDRSKVTDETMRNVRVPYLETSTKFNGRRRAYRTPGHETIPHFIGRWVPRNDRPESFDNYAACILALLQPFRDVVDVKRGHSTWRAAFDAFMEGTSESVHAMVGNFQYYYDAGDQATLKTQEYTDAQVNESGQPHGCRDRGDDDRHDGDEEPMSDNDVDMLLEEAIDQTAEDLKQAIRKSLSEDEGKHAAEAVEVGKAAGIFCNADEDRPWLVRRAGERLATPRIMDLNVQWQQSVKQFVSADQHPAPPPGQSSPSTAEVNVGQVLPDEIAAGPRATTTSNPHVEKIDIDAMNIAELEDVQCLNTEQRRAVEIVGSHLKSTLKGEKPAQLLLLVLGEGGTGKSKVINTISTIFETLGVASTLGKAAPTGVAASHIGGSTIHSLGGIPVGNTTTVKFDEQNRSRTSSEKRRATFGKMEYLIIDEISMVTQDLLWALSNAAGEGKARARDSVPVDKPFGNINVILFGDFHQLPPPVQKTSALFMEVYPTEHCRYGRQIFTQFTKAVILREQMRLNDPAWIGILRRSRIGACTEDDVAVIRSLVLRPGTDNVPDFDTLPWSRAVLITPRNGVRKEWNRMMTRKVCRDTKATLFVSPSEDYIKKTGKPLSFTQRINLVTPVKRVKGAKGAKAVKGKRKATIDRSLEPAVEIAIGMSVMLTRNTATNASLANGTRATIEDIHFDPREPPYDPAASVVYLVYPPAVIIIRPAVEIMPCFEGLLPGQVPIEPTAGVMHMEGKKLPFTRRQFALAPAYAFTDYRSQGQTIECVLVDISPVPTGGITPFNAYTALSRSRGRHTIRLLRDFRDSLFTHHPCIELEEEDARLEEMDQRTTDWFNKGGHMYH